MCKHLIIFSLESIEPIYLIYEHLSSIQMYRGKQIKPLLRHLQSTWGRPTCSEKKINRILNAKMSGNNRHSVKE